MGLYSINYSEIWFYVTTRAISDFLFLLADFALEIIGSIRFFFSYARGNPAAHGHRIPIGATGQRKMDFGEAFGVKGTTYTQNRKGSGSPRGMASGGGASESNCYLKPSYNEDI